MDRKEAIEIISKNLPSFRQEYGVVRIGLFGSTARDEISNVSDIDIAIELDEEYKTIKNFLNLNRLLEKLLHRKVDLGIESTLKPLAKKNIEKEIIYIQ